MVNPLRTKLLLALSLNTALLACSSISQVTNQHFEYTLAVRISGQDTRSSTEAKYNASVVVWLPENGLAVLGSDHVVDQVPQLISQEKTNSDFVNTDQTIGTASTFTDSATFNGSASVNWLAASSYWNNGVRVWISGSNTMPTQERNAQIWDASKLMAAWQASPKLGKDIKVAVIDTGLDVSHPIFANRLVSSNQWWDFVDGDNNPSEEGKTTDAGYGHGTGIAGTIVQVAPYAKIMPLRVLKSTGQGDELDVVAAVGLAIANGANIINLSLGSDANSIALDLLLDVATKKGIVVVASAGNSSQLKSAYPALKAKTNLNILSVASYGFVNGLFANYNYNKTKSIYSNYGSDISLAAPGEAIFTAYPGLGGKTWNGTSFAAAMASGSVALRIGQGPLGTSASNLIKKNFLFDFDARIKFMCSCAYLDMYRMQLP